MPHRPGRSRSAALGLATVLVAAVVVLTASLGAGGSRTSRTPPASTTDAIAGAMDPSVVDVVATLAGARGQVAATGVVLSAPGTVLTNNHVIAGAIAITVRVPATGRGYDATVTGYDVTDDVAVLQVRDAARLPPAVLGERDRLRIGDRVVALGNGDGRGGTPVGRAGTVVALDQRVDVEGEAGREHLAGAIAFTAPVRPGDSGGPLVDAAGRVVGLVTATAETVPGTTVGYAIRIAAAVAIARAIEAGRSSASVHAGPRAVLGVAIKSSVRGAGPSRGAVVGLVDVTGPAYAIGVRAGDVVVSVGATAVHSATELNQVLDRYRPGQTVVVRFRDAHGRIRTGSARLAPGPPL